ncbi:MAG: SDR family NAD(P)-dependent oxidoreductase [Bacteroidota bacterium]
MNLKGRTAIVTGGAMGIGFATAKLLVNEGCVVTLWDINHDELQKAKLELEQVGGKVFAHYCDVTDKNRVYELTEIAHSEMGSVDILINNAGYVKGGELLDHSDEVWEKTVNVNLTSMLYTIRAVLPSMYKKNSGHIVNISSASGLLGVAGLSVYAATKWAVWGLTESMRFESWNNGKKGVRWSSVHPSYLAKGLFEGAKLGFWGNLIVPLVKSHNVIAQAIVYGALKKRKYIVRRPRSLRLAIFLRGILPDLVFQKLMIVLGVHRSMETWRGREK